MGGQPRSREHFRGTTPSDPLLHFISTTAINDRIIQVRQQKAMLICQKLWWCLESHRLVQRIQRSVAFPEGHDEQMVLAGRQPIHTVPHRT